jgi:hypothetical protein
MEILSIQHLSYDTYTILKGFTRLVNKRLYKVRHMPGKLVKVGSVIAVYLAVGFELRIQERVTKSSLFVLSELPQSYIRLIYSTCMRQ